jgi:hypothetical protein
MGGVGCAAAETGHRLHELRGWARAAHGAASHLLVAMCIYRRRLRLISRRRAVRYYCSPPPGDPCVQEVACKEDRAFSRDLLSGRVPFDPEASAPGSSARPPVHMHAHASQLHLARIASVLRSKSPLARSGAPTRICHREWLTGPFRRAHETHRERTGIVPT